MDQSHCGRLFASDEYYLFVVQDDQDQRHVSQCATEPKRICDVLFDVSPHSSSSDEGIIWCEPSPLDIICSS
jgi:hypothetical protein